jgi:L-lactate dehydrogenase complex protein LldF
MDLMMRGAEWAFSDGAHLNLLEKGLPVGRLAAGRDKVIKKLPGLAGKWTQSRDIPAPPGQSFRQWWAKEHGAADGVGPSAGDQQSEGEQA